MQSQQGVVFSFGWNGRLLWPVVQKRIRCKSQKFNNEVQETCYKTCEVRENKNCPAELRSAGHLREKAGIAAASTAKHRPPGLAPPTLCNSSYTAVASKWQRKQDKLCINMYTQDIYNCMYIFFLCMFSLH